MGVFKQECFLADIPLDKWRWEDFPACGSKIGGTLKKKIVVGHDVNGDSVVPLSVPCGVYSVPLGSVVFEKVMKDMEKNGKAWCKEAHPV